MVGRIGQINWICGTRRVEELGECRTNAGSRDHGDTDCWVNRIKYPVKIRVRLTVSVESNRRQASDDGGLWRGF
ncbi:MAG: hypothetical protein CMM81_04045 [Rhodospirillales bacterium]|nr:hypothetical protein [Rhodospirillales bacterium]